ncbi:50S ribosomal protein L20 [Candidatus Vidania fulgoroideorum]
MHRKKLFKATKGFIGRRKNVYKIAYQANLKSLIYSYRDRKKTKSLNRSIWIKTINNKLKQKIKYNNFIFILKLKKIIINRKVILFLITSNTSCFQKLLNFMGC